MTESKREESGDGQAHRDRDMRLGERIECLPGPARLLHKRHLCFRKGEKEVIFGQTESVLKIIMPFWLA